MYLLTDILVKNDTVVSCDYALRQTFINEIVFCSGELKNLNDHLTIGIHPVFHSENENMVHIFLNNFLYKKELCAVEKIINFKKNVRK